MELVESSIPNTYWTKKSIEGFGEGKMIELQYHEDWNWLMKVVEKIEISHSKEFNICESRVNINHNSDTSTENFITVDITGTKIEAVYMACLDYIQWNKQQSEAYKKCDRCSFDIEDEERNIIEHICIDNNYYTPPQSNFKKTTVRKNKTLEYALKQIKLTGEENGLKAFIQEDKLFIGTSIGKIYQLAEKEIKYQAEEYLKSELEMVLNN
jgi:hypothetical protein